MRTLRKNNKGVSPIIATLLLIVIAVAAAVVTYAFVSGFIGTATSTSKQTGSMSVDSYQILSATQVQAYVRNTGTTSLNVTSVYLDGALATIAPAAGQVISPGQVQPINATLASVNLNDGLSHQLRFVAADGTPVSIGVVKTS